MSILELTRLIQACCQPLTGQRATGSILLKSATGADVTVGHGRFMFPIINGQVRHELAFKTAINPATRSLPGALAGSWTATTVGTPVSILSNLGGVRHNLPAGTRFLIDQPLVPALVDRPRIATPTAGGEDMTGDLVLYNFVAFETFGAQPTLEAFRSAIGGRFPAAIINWTESEPSDGQTTSAVTRGTHLGARNVAYSEMFDIRLISSRSDSEAERRGQAVRILDEMTALLLDKVAIDGAPMSSPGGVHIRRRQYEPSGGDAFYRAFQVYRLTLSVQSVIQQRDSREYDLLRKFRIDAPREDHPAEDLPVVVNNLVDNPQT